MTITYCQQPDLEATWSAVALLRSVDDDQDGTISTAEEAIVTRIIERAANKMNASLEMRYQLSDLANNSWARDCNTALAVYFLSTRRGNPAPDEIQEQYDGFLADLAEIRLGRLKVPQAPESFDAIPSVINFDTNLKASRRKVEPVAETSSPR